MEIINMENTESTKRPFFSIIIPCYNSKNTLGRLLQSIVDQKMDYNDIQVVLADDCSTELLLLISPEQPLRSMEPIIVSIMDTADNLFLF